jgi:hypothetical protein
MFTVFLLCAFVCFICRPSDFTVLEEPSTRKVESKDSAFANIPRESDTLHYGKDATVYRIYM